MDEHSKRDGNRLYPKKDRISIPKLAKRLAQHEAEIEAEMLGEYGETSDLRTTIRASFAELGCDSGVSMVSRIAQMFEDGVMDVYGYADGLAPPDASHIVSTPNAWWVSAADAEKMVSLTANQIEEVVRFDSEEHLKHTEGRYSLREAASAIAGPLGILDLILRKLEDAALKGELPVYSPGQLVRHEYPLDGVVRGFYEEAYWNDLNAWLAKHEPRVKQRFEAPHGSSIEAIPLSSSPPDAVPLEDGTQVASMKAAAHSLTSKAMQQPQEPDVIAWNLRRPNRMDTLQAMIYRVIKTAHDAGRPRPRARELMDEIAAAKPSDFIQIIGGDLEYYDSGGNSKIATAQAIEKRIDRITGRKEGR